jgi:hypothetical protein
MTDTEPTSPELPHVEIVDFPGAGRWDTLAHAFAAYRYPLENLPLVQRLVDAIGIDHYEGIPSRTYIRAVRRDRRPILYINSGFTSGLLSETEILDAVGDVDRAQEPNGRWYVVHPTNQLRDGSRAPAGAAGRDYGACPSCGMQLPASGICDFC